MFDMTRIWEGYVGGRLRRRSAGVTVAAQQPILRDSTADPSGCPADALEANGRSQSGRHSRILPLGCPHWGRPVNTIDEGRRVKRFINLVAAALTVCGVAVAGGGAASAAPKAEVTAASVSASCFGYTGQFLHRAPLKVDLAGGWRECFGIGTNRGIYHAWPNSGGWHEMPHGGRADDTNFAFFDSAGRRVIEVTVGEFTDYCSTLIPSRGGWQPWVRC